MMSWNGFPKHAVKSVMSRLSKTRDRIPTENDPNEQPEDKINIWIRVPYLGDKGKQLVDNLIKKIRRFSKKNINFKVFYENKKVGMFCSAKDKVCRDQKANLIYQITCPGCGGKYIGKTDRNFITRMGEQGGRNDQPMHKHLYTCDKYQDLLCMYMCPDLNVNLHIFNDVMNNSVIMDSNDNFNQLEFLEAYYIKQLKPTINFGLKASRELQLFG